MSAWISTMAAKIVNMPWMEEVLMILITAVVFIVTHLSMVSKKGARRIAKKMQAMSNDLPERVQESTKAREPWKATRFFTPAPQTAMEVQGVTDATFTGSIVAYRPNVGYGFIKCAQLYARFNRDVFLHRAQIGTFQVGDRVSFRVFLNKEGHPQAKRLLPHLVANDELAPGNPPEAAPEAAPAEPVRVKTSTLNANAKSFVLGSQGGNSAFENPCKWNMQDFSWTDSGALQAPEGVSRDNQTGEWPMQSWGQAGTSGRWGAPHAAAPAPAVDRAVAKSNALVWRPVVRTSE